MEFAFKLLNHFITTGLRLDGKTLHIRASFLEWTAILIKLAHMLYEVHSTIIKSEL